MRSFFDHVWLSGVMLIVLVFATVQQLLVACGSKLAVYRQLQTLTFEEEEQDQITIASVRADLAGLGVLAARFQPDDDSDILNKELMKYFSKALLEGAGAMAADNIPPTLIISMAMSSLMLLTKAIDCCKLREKLAGRTGKIYTGLFIGAIGMSISAIAGWGVGRVGIARTTCESHMSG